MPEPIDLTTTDWSVSAVKPGPAGTVDVVTAVAAAMAELPAIGKDSKAAKEQGGYPYRGIEAITGHLQPLLAKHRVLTVPRAEILATVPSPGMNEGWTDVTMRVEWLVMGADGSSFTAVTNGIGRDKSDKGANKAQTQAHKYLLLPLFCIADRKDDADGDSYEDGRAAPNSTAEPAASKEQLNEIHRLGVVSTPAQWDRFVAWSKDEKLPAQDRLTARQADRAIAHLTEIVAAAAAALEDTTEKGAGTDGPASDGDAATSGDGADGHDVGRTVPEPAPATPGEGAEPTTAGSVPDPPGAISELNARAEVIAAKAAGKAKT